MVSDSTLDTDIWTDIRTILVAASLSTTSGTSISSAIITAAYVDKEPNKPQVVIYPISTDETKDKFGSYYGRNMINADIACVGTSSLTVDQLSNQVKSALSETTIDGIDLVGITSDYALQSPGNNKYHMKTMTFSYLRE